MSQFDGFQDHQLPALAQILLLEEDEYLPCFESLLNRSEAVRTPGDLDALADTVDILRARWQYSTSHGGDDLRRILTGLTAAIDSIHRVCSPSVPNHQSLESFLVELGTACGDMVHLLRELVAWMKNAAPEI